MSVRKAAFLAAMVAALSLGAGDAFARAGGGFSSGSRGARTWSAPAATPTAPRSAAPMERSVTPQQQPSFGGATTPAARPGFFSGGFGRGLLGGLLGAGLFGMLFGHGMFGGLGGLMSILGLVLQVGLIVLLVRFAIGFFRRNQQPQFAGGPQPQPQPRPQGAAYNAPGAGFGGAAPQQPPLAIVKADYDAFERRLGEVQAAYSAEDVGALRRLTTPEMASYLEGELAENARRGQVNRVADVKLLQGDLSESWREPDAEYATVAIRFSMTDAMLDRATGKLVAGSAAIPEEARELWTFRRAPGASADGWTVSAIQQAA